jgi:hypothetical protein
MTTILVATDSGCRVFSEPGEERLELAGRRMGPLACHVDGTCIAGHGTDSSTSTLNSSPSCPAGPQSSVEE